MGHGAGIVPRNAGHQTPFRIRQMNVPFHRDRKIRGKRFRITLEHVHQPFPQVNGVPPRIDAPEHAVPRPESTHGSEKNASFLRRAAQREQGIVKVKGEEIPGQSGPGQGTDRQKTHQFHFRPVLPSPRRASPHARRVPPAEYPPPPAPPRECVLPRVRRKEWFPERVPPQG